MIAANARQSAAHFMSTVRHVRGTGASGKGGGKPSRSRAGGRIAA
jgi:hypothetical protein